MEEMWKEKMVDLVTEDWKEKGNNTKNDSKEPVWKI